MIITVNLASRPYADIGPAIKRLRIAMAVFFLIGIGLAFGVHAFHQKAEEARATEERVQKQIDAINRERMGYQNRMRLPENAQLLTQVGALNQIFAEKTFSWTLGMEDLETVLPGGVQVTSLEPVRNKDGSITLRLRVVGPRDRSVELVANLEHSRQFLLPRIVGESSDSTSGPNERLEAISASNRVNFELLAEYNSNAPIESRAQRKAQEKKETPAPSAIPAPRFPGSTPLLRQMQLHPPAPGAPQRPVVQTSSGLQPRPRNQLPLFVQPSRPPGNPVPMQNSGSGGPR